MWPYVGGILWDPAVCPPLVIRAGCCRGGPYVGYVYPSIMARSTTLGALVGYAGLQLFGRETMRHMVAMDLLEHGVGLLCGWLHGLKWYKAGVMTCWWAEQAQIQLSASLSVGLGAGAGLLAGRIRFPVL